MLKISSTRFPLLAVLAVCAGVAGAGALSAAPMAKSRALLNATPALVQTVQDWRAEQGRTWRNDLTSSAPVPRVAPSTPYVGRLDGTNPGYGPYGYSYNGPAFDRYVTDNNLSTSTGDYHGATVDPGLRTCPPKSETGEPSTQTYFSSDGTRKPCP